MTSSEPTSSEAPKAPGGQRPLRTAAGAVRGWANKDLWTALAAITTASAAVGALVFTGLNLRETRHQYGLSQQVQVTDRFGKSVEHLGSDQQTVRVGGVYALERIARDSAADSQTVVEVLGAFLRSRELTNCPDVELPVDTSPVAEPAPADLWAAAAAISHTYTPFRDHQLDLRKTCLVMIDLSGKRFSHTVFMHAWLTWSKLCATTLDGANLQGARVDFANLEGADLSGANLEFANLSYSRLDRVNLSALDGRGADLAHADLHATSLRGANLSRANFFMADLGYAHLEGANLADADLHQLLSTDHLTYDDKTVWPEGYKPPPSDPAPNFQYSQQC
ncbi:pentapeptide repeat-containing protein [Nocardia sp. NPDC056611]|uniref:pentapeptide repeat-containing protein n=1 Tax=Nocardia sp. NPDC056611 TaxID=3345877 RepID=UPI00366BA216